MMYGMADADLGLRIKRAREAKRLDGQSWRQEDLAAKLGVSVRTVGRWERGSVPRSALGALEVVLAPYFTVDAASPAAPTDPRERELWDLLTAEDAPPDDRLTPAEAWEVIEYKRRAKRRTA